jgi:hypothetical protein
MHEVDPHDEDSMPEQDETATRGGRIAWLAFGFVFLTFLITLMNQGAQLLERIGLLAPVGR